MTDQNQQAQLPPRPETCNEIIMDYMDSLEAALAAANRRAEERERQLRQALRERDEERHNLEKSYARADRLESALAAANRREAEKRETPEQAWERAIEVGFLAAWEDGYITCPYVPYVLPGEKPKAAKRPTQPEQTQKEHGE